MTAPFSSPDSPAVSVVVPCFNAGCDLIRCVNSVLDQTFPDLELIIVDDGSTDGAPRRLAGQIEDPRVTIVSQNNQGAAAARNRGLAVARGRWINFLDADDLLHKQKLAAQLDYLQQHPELEMVAGAWLRFSDDPPPIDAAVVGDPLWAPHGAVDWQVLALASNLMMQPAAWLLSHALVKRIDPWRPDLSLNDDGEYFARAMLAAGQVGFCRDAVSYYRSGSDQNLSAGRSRAHFYSALQALVSIDQALTAVEESDRVRQALALAYSRLAVESYPYDSGVSDQCRARAAAHGCFQPHLGGGRWVKRLAGPLGWRAARRLQAWVYDLGYRRLGQRRYRQRGV